MDIVEMGILKESVHKRGVRRAYDYYYNVVKALINLKEYTY